MKKIQVTVWQKPDELIQTARGPIPVRLWCEMERWRFARAGHKAAVIGRPDRRIALFRLPVRQRGPASPCQRPGRDIADSFIPARR